MVLFYGGIKKFLQAVIIITHTFHRGWYSFRETTAENQPGYRIGIMRGNIIVYAKKGGCTVV